jgi:non-ribosomal peptide synthetase component F
MPGANARRASSQSPRDIRRRDLDILVEWTAFNDNFAPDPRQNRRKGGSRKGVSHAVEKVSVMTYCHLAKAASPRNATRHRKKRDLNRALRRETKMSRQCPDVAQASDLSSFLRAAAVDRPSQPAYIFADGAIRFDELDQQSDLCARGLGALGIERGDRVALLVRPSQPLFVLTFGLPRRGAIPVLIDPGIGRVHLARCLAEAGPSAFIGVSVAHAARVLLGWAKGSVRTLVTVGARWFWGGASFEDVMKAGANSKPRPFPSPGPNDLAAIAFTSGSTGPPKGAVYTHQILAAQAVLLRDHFGIRPGERDLATFPLFAFFDPVWQATGVIPRRDSHALRGHRGASDLLHFAAGASHRNRR